MTNFISSEFKWFCLTENDEFLFHGNPNIKIDYSLGSRPFFHNDVVRGYTKREVEVHCRKWNKFVRKGNKNLIKQCLVKPVKLRFICFSGKDIK